MQSQTAERIVHTANALMVERGYSAFSYADIAQSIGIRKASIHHHFPSKADLGAAVLQAHRHALVQATEHLDGHPNPLHRIRAYLQHWEGCIRGGTVPFCVAALLGAELPSLPPDVQAEVRLHFTTLAAWLEKTLRAGVKQGVITLRNSAATEAELLMATVHGAMLSARATGNCDIFHAVTTAALKRITSPRD